ncbi:MAG: AI-2E family transporter, partial [Lapillicoccus sp.]
MLGRLRTFRERQRERVAAARRRPPLMVSDHETADEQLTHDLLADTLPRVIPVPGGPADGPAPAPRGRRAFGQAGRPLNRQSPFYVGFVGAFGVLAAYGLWQAVASLTTVLTLLTVAFFLTLSLNPLVEVLVRRGLGRGGAVAVVFATAVAVFVLLGFVVVPPVTQQAAELARNAPGYVAGLLSNPRVQDIDQHYHVVEKVQEEVDKRLTDSTFMSQVAGGVLGAGRIVAEGIFSTVTVLVLTLYFLSSLPTLKQAAYAVVPASRRPRVISLSEEIMRRVGSYAIGQVVVAAVNACFAWL